MSFMPLDQDRARVAWSCVQPETPVNPNYRGLVRQFPAMVQSIGIGQSVAFLAAKGAQQHLELLEHLNKWLFNERCPVRLKQPSSDEEKQDARRLLLHALVNKNPGVWWQVEQEAIAFCIWLKRMAEAGEKDSVAEGQSTKEA